MLKLGNFRVNWRHFNPSHNHILIDDWGRKYVRQFSAKEFFGTKCFIYPLDRTENEQALAVGIAKLHKYSRDDSDAPKGGFGYDVYEKNMGRELSLLDAISKLDLILTDEDEDKIWDDYYNRT